MDGIRTKIKTKRTTQIIILSDDSWLDHTDLCSNALCSVCLYFVMLLLNKKSEAVTTQTVYKPLTLHDLLVYLPCFNKHFALAVCS